MEDTRLNDTGTITGTVLACCLLAMLAVSYGVIGYGLLDIVRTDVVVRASALTPFR